MKILFFLFFLPVASVAIGWTFWFYPDFDQQEVPRWRRNLLFGGLACASIATSLGVPFLNHTVTAALSREIPLSGGWIVVASLVCLCVPLILLSVFLGKGQARLVLSAWLIAFLAANYVGLMLLMD